MNRTMVKGIVAVVIATVLAAIAWMGIGYYHEAELKMDAVKYMEANWYGGYSEDLNVVSVKEISDGRYCVTYTDVIDGVTYQNDAVMNL